MAMRDRQMTSNPANYVLQAAMVSKITLVWTWWRRAVLDDGNTLRLSGS